MWIKTQLKLKPLHCKTVGNLCQVYNIWSLLIALFKAYDLYTKGGENLIEKKSALAQDSLYDFSTHKGYK